MPHVSEPGGTPPRERAPHVTDISASAETAPPRARDASLATRVLSALVLAPLFLGAAYAGGWIFVVLVAALVGLGTREYFAMALPGRAAAPILAGTSGVVAVGVRFLSPEGVALDLLLACTLLAALMLGLTVGEPREALKVSALTLLGALYVGWLFSYLVGLRELPRVGGATATAERRVGFALVLVPVALTWVTDIAAYFVGRTWGHRKLLPRVSPGKTLAGAIGGTLAAGLVGVLLFTSAPAGLPRLGTPWGFALGVAGSALAQTGDLAESLLKRACGVKDSSRLIPGHGGVLDRFDALLFVLPAAYHFFRSTVP